MKSFKEFKQEMQESVYTVSSEEFDLSEAGSKKPPMKLYHHTYSSALAHAKDQLNSRGYDISDEDWFHHISSGPTKPKEGKTNKLHIPLTTMDGMSTKKHAHIQVYNRGNDLPNNYELNMYVDK